MFFFPNPQTYFRVQPKSRDPRKLLDPKTWQSRVWIGEAEKRCPVCRGSGEVETWDEDEDGNEYSVLETCANCGGSGVVEDVRRGVSVFRTLQLLREYLERRHANLKGDVVIELTGDLSDDEDHDAAEGALLIYPKSIVAVHSVNVLR